MEGLKKNSRGPCAFLIAKCYCSRENKYLSEGNPECNECAKWEEREDGQD